MSVELALFPLDTVLFPHMSLGLHVFEDRYLQMLRDCRDRGTSFGVVAIRQGLEVGPRPSPFDVGTLAQLREVGEREDGQLDVSISGASRFRINGFTRRSPYLVARVTYLADSRGDGGTIEQLATSVALQFRHHASLLRQLRGKGDVDFVLPNDPELLSYVVSASIQTETARKQELLETNAAADRLRACLRLLRREEILLAQHLTRQPAQLSAMSPN